MPEGPATSQYGKVALKRPLPPECAIDYLDDEGELFNEDYPVTRLGVGKYLFVITNDIRYLETNYSIGLNVSVLDWRFVKENAEEQINFGLITSNVLSTVNFGNL